MGSQTLFSRLYLPERTARVAALYEHKEITYEKLRDGTVSAAEALHASGIGAGDRVAILLNDSPEFITSFVAIISLGAIAVPINLALRREESRGAHFREDYPNKDTQAGKFNLVVYKGSSGEMNIRRELLPEIREDLKQIIEEMK